MEKNSTREAERGQNLVIFAVIIVVLVALAGLVLDGGFALAKRREAQNAADAGALAGATAFCEGDTALAQSQALDYAINRNHATTASVGLTDEDVVVTATVQHQTFLMGLFGSDVISPTATASAGCYVPCSVKGVLPVAWLCTTLPAEDEVGCGIHYDAEGQSQELYVIMDSIKSEGDACKDPPNNDYQPLLLDCDTNDDGTNELKAGGDRSWLDLDGQANLDGFGGARQLVEWITNGYSHDLNIHTWYGGKSGTSTNVFRSVTSLPVNNIVLLPVFDEVPCNGLPNVNCTDRFHTLARDGVEDGIVPSGGYSELYFHIISFSAFRVTCVSTNQHETCPGKDAAIAANLGTPAEIPANTKSIEGYFVKYDTGKGKCEGPDTGVHTIYLNK